MGGGVQSNWSKNGPKIVFLEWFNSARKLVGVYFPKCICVSVFVLKYNLEMKFDRCQNFDQPTTTFSHKVVSFGTTKSWNGINTVKLDKHRKQRPIFTSWPNSENSKSCLRTYSGAEPIKSLKSMFSLRFIFIIELYACFVFVCMFGGWHWDWSLLWICQCWWPKNASQDGSAAADKVCTSSHSTWGEGASPAPSRRHLKSF